MTTEEYRSIHEGGNQRRPNCDPCDCFMDWVVPVVAMDAPKDPAGRMVVMRDIYDRNPATGDMERFQRAEVVDSVHTMRRIEADSERRYRNGEGEPMRFRALSQDRSNMDQGLFGREGQIGAQHYDSGQQPTKKPNVGVVRHGQKKPTIKVVRGGGVTALKG